MLIRVALSAALLLGGATGPSDTVPGCDNECDIENGESFVYVGGTHRPIGPDPGYGIDPPSSDDGTFIGAGNPLTAPPPLITLCNTDDDTFPITDPLGGTCTNPDPDDPAVTLPYPTISDLAIFTPQPATLATEPEAAGLLGKPTNFLSTANTHTVTGTLFSHPVTVRFTPDTYTFDYGDGTIKTVTTANTSWHATPLPQFTPTNTSHTYTTKGPTTTTVTVAYTAEVSFNTNPAWLPVAGHVYATAPAHTITIYEALTALVDNDCNANPNGTGCP